MEISTAGHKTICVPVTSEADYRKLIHKGSTFRSFLDQRIADYPELFPAGIANGYWLHDAIHSKKRERYHSSHQTGDQPSGVSSPS